MEDHTLVSLASLPAEQIARLFDHVPDIFFFAKDSSGRFLCANRALLDRFGIREEADIVGTRDQDRYPRHLAERLAKTDRQVMETGLPLLGVIDVLFDATGVLQWFITSKLPLKDHSGKIIGVVGVTRRHGSEDHSLDQGSRLEKILNTIRKNPSQLSSVRELSRMAGLSERQLNRQFHQTLGISPKEFSLRCRIQAAAQALREGKEPLVSIAGKFGFCDQSAFTRQFRLQIGLTPAEYRKRYH